MYIKWIIFFSLLKFGIIKFLRAAIASKTIVELNDMTTLASLKYFSPGPHSTYKQFLDKYFKIFFCCYLLFYP